MGRTGSALEAVPCSSSGSTTPSRRLGPLSGVARRAKLDFFLARVPPDARILDVGCADNWFKRAAAARGWSNVTGVDLVPPADIVGDVRQWESLGLEAHSFDAVVAFEVIEHGDFWAVFRSLLKPDGQLFVTTPIPRMDPVCRVMESLRLLQQRGSPHTNLTDLRRVPGFTVMERRLKAGVSQWGVLRPSPAGSAGPAGPAELMLPDPGLYDREYLLSAALDGLQDYLAGGLSVVRRRQIDSLDVGPGCRVLDLGCGRGESSAEIARRGATVTALDYSLDAVVLTRELLGDRGTVLQANAVELPFAARSFDRVLMSDVVEHVPWPMAVRLLAEVDRVLTPGGRAMVHTAPNTWFTTVVKRPLNAGLRLTRRHAAVARFAEYDRLRDAMHPNELNPLSLRRLMREAGLDARCWVDPDVLRSGSSDWTESWPDSAVRLIGAVAGSIPFRLLLGNDMYATFYKSARRG